MGIATRLGQYEMLGLDYTLVPAAADVNAVTVDDIADTAQTYFAEHYIGLLLPERTPTGQQGSSESDSDAND